MNRKGQEEMIGFAMIVVIVSLMIIGFLAFSMRSSGSNKLESAEVGEFLDSVMHTTTECTGGSVNSHLDIGELIKECYNNPLKVCLNSEKSVCAYLNETLEEVIVKSWSVGSDKYYTGFKLNINFEPKKARLEAGEKDKEIMTKSYGVCNKTRIGNEYLISDRKQEGSIVVNAELCTA